MNETLSGRTIKYRLKNISRPLDPDHESIARVILRDYFEYNNYSIWELYLWVESSNSIDACIKRIIYLWKMLSPKSRDDILFITWRARGILSVY